MEIIKRWNTSKHAVFNIGYHLIWCPKYRRKVLIDGIDIRLKEIITTISNKHNWAVESMEVMSDHVHIFIKVSPDMSPAYIVSQLKGTSSRILREEFPKLKSRIPTLWTRSYYCESVGHISEETVKKYIEDQKSK